MKFKPSHDALSSTIDNEVVIMSLSADEYISLNDVGSRIWELISEAPLGVDELVQKLMEEYEVGEATCRAEVTAFLEELGTKGLLEQLDA